MVSRLTRSRLFWKLFGSYVALTLVTAGLTGALVGWHLERALLEYAAEDLRVDAALVRALVTPALDQLPDATLQGRVRALVWRVAGASPSWEPTAPCWPIPRRSRPGWRTMPGVRRSWTRTTTASVGPSGTATRSA